VASGALAKQTIMVVAGHGRIIAVDSAYDVDERNRARDVVVTGSYCGVLPARFVSEHAPRGAIGVDCAIGKDGAGIAGLWYYEALGIPAAAVDIETVELGDGADVFENGIVSRLNAPAVSAGAATGQRAREAARLMLENSSRQRLGSEITNRTVVWTHPSGRAVVCTDSIAFGQPEDRDRNVLCTAGHTGRSAIPYLERVRPLAFICSDGGKGRNGAGVAGLSIADGLGLAGAAVDARSARMGDGLSTYHDGIISARNELAAVCGVELGQPAADAARHLIERLPEAPEPWS
jgi:hypothetical protein